jgi:uncharacterized protein
MTGMATHGQRRSPRSPLVIDITRLGRRPGSMKTVQETVAAPDRIGVDLIGIAAGTPMELDVKLEAVSEGVLVTGTVSAATTGECARCLSPIAGHVDVDVTELFAYEGSDTEATTEDDEVGHVVTDRDGDSIDLEQTIIDAVGMALPFSPVCSDDCPGLCPECGTPLASVGPDHHHEAIDPRWAKLTSLVPTEQEPDESGAPS